MNFKVIPIHPFLDNFVEQILQIEYDSKEVKYKNFPISNLSLVFNYGDDAFEIGEKENTKVPPLSIEGFRESPVEYTPKGTTRLFIVKLRLIAKGALRDLDGPFPIYNTWDLDAVYEGNKIQEQLGNTLDNGHRIKYLEAFLFNIFSRNEVNPYVLEAIHIYRKNGWHLSSWDVAKRLGYSKKQLERIFIRSIGLTPKRLAKINRFQNSITLLKNHSSNIAQIALSSGYFDQPHFNKDFKKFTGMTPYNFLKVNQSFPGSQGELRDKNCNSNLTIYS